MILYVPGPTESVIYRGHAELVVDQESAPISVEVMFVREDSPDGPSVAGGILVLNPYDALLLEPRLIGSVWPVRFVAGVYGSLTFHVIPTTALPLYGHYTVTIVEAT